MARFRLVVCLFPSASTRVSLVSNRFFGFLCFAIFAFLTLQTALAAKAPTRDPQALALLAQCGAAMGAASIQDTYAIGTLTTADPNAPTVPITTQTKGAAERYDMAFSDGNQTYALNAGSSWGVRQDKQVKMPYALTAYHRPEHVPALACVLDVPKSNMSFVYVAQEKFLNSAVHHIRIFVPAPDDDNTDSLVSELNVFLDTQTLLVLKTERYVFDPEQYQNYSV